MDVNWADSNNATPFMHACRYNNKEVMMILMEHTKNIEFAKTDEYSHTALFHAIDANSEKPL